LLHGRRKQHREKRKYDAERNGGPHVVQDRVGKGSEETEKLLDHDVAMLGM